MHTQNNACNRKMSSEYAPSGWPRPLLLHSASTQLLPTFWGFHGPLELIHKTSRGSETMWSPPWPQGFPCTLTDSAVDSLEQRKPFVNSFDAFQVGLCLGEVHSQLPNCHFALGLLPGEDCLLPEVPSILERTRSHGQLYFGKSVFPFLSLFPFPWNLLLPSVFQTLLYK